MLSALFDTAGFPRRWDCGHWTALHGWVHIAADVAIFAAYAAIPAVLGYFALRRKDVPFIPVFWLFASFIFFCGVGHLIEASLFWHPWYRLSGLVKVCTVTASWATVVALTRIVPQALALPGLSKLNAALEHEIGERRKAEEHFRSVFEDTNLAMVVTGIDNRFVRVNAAFAALFGYSQAELLTMSMEDVTHHDYLADSHAQREALLAGETNFFQMEKRYLHKDGSVFWGLTNVSLVRDALGQPVQYLGQVQDITERKHAEERFRGSADETLRQSEERFQLLVDSVQDYAIVMLDPEGRIATWNDGAKRLKGYEGEEIQGRYFSCFYPEVDIASNKPEQDLAAARQLGQVEADGWRIRRDGSRFWANVAITALWDRAGQLRGYAKVTRDFTRRKGFEDRVTQLNTDLAVGVSELRDVNQELESFCYSVSHDLRTPLRAIDGFSRILLKDYGGSLPAEAAEFLQDIRGNTLQMGRLIDDLLAFSRMSRQALVKQTVAPDAIVRQCIRELEPERGAAEVQVGELSECQADPVLLKQVWINLLSNALKYSGKRAAPLVQIGCCLTGHPGETAYFVKDNGVGFDMRYAGKLFGVFQRLHRAEDYPGTGVGLALVQRIIHRHAGRIWAEAVPGNGATFYFTLP